ncbi:monooxygenase [Hypoxylon sp. FL1150]|nr:monooxygenase [Hypoxylon sp. FL1150]
MSEVHDVIVAGAGPIGLFVACELALAKIPVLVLERDAKLESPWKDGGLGLRGLSPASMEGFYRRGLMEQVLTFEGRPHFKPGFRFAGMLLNANKLDMSRYKYRFPGPSLNPGLTYLQHLEEVFLARAESLGVTILRGMSVTDVSQDDSGVTVRAGDRTFRTKWLAGCDGGRSAVRHAAGFDFVGTEPEFLGYSFTGELDDPDKLGPAGPHFGTGGMHVVGHLKTYFVLDFADKTFDRAREPTREHLQKVLARVSGSDVKITKLYHASSFTDRSKQAATYRKGRVVLAGDAAHIHSSLGAQGLNLGLGDAMNLGWKLAATIRASRSSEGSPDFTLLDTYDKERQPVGRWTLEWTRAQVTALRPGPFGTAIRNLIHELLHTTDGNNLALDHVWGLSIRYGPEEEDAHPLVGCSAPDYELEDGERLGVKLVSGKGLLVSFDNEAELKELADAYEDKVDYLGIGAKERLGIKALLVRPDGFVAWVAEDKADLDAAKAALGRWFGKASK